MTLKVGDKVQFTIIENGYWKGESGGTIIGETAKFWIVHGSASFFWNYDKRKSEPRRFAKTGPACVRKRNG